ncbi:phage/plasmid primase, P4 family [Kaistia sp. UC242_56]|uniref:DNA primase family protein n=1 Tax=Kaistia sp. UC242_56 TaxID=3374625 RepID=UPI00378EEF16
MSITASDMVVDHSKDLIVAIIDDAEPISDGAAADAPAADKRQGARKRASQEDIKRAAAQSLSRHLALFPLTDLGNAERFARRNQMRFLHVPEIGWLAWDGKRWAKDGAEGHLLKAVHDTVRAIQDEAAAIAGTEADIVVRVKSDGEVVRMSDMIASWGRASEAAPKLQAIPKHATAYLSASADSLDADPWRFNVLNGTISIDRTGGAGDVVKFDKHSPSDRITKLAPVVYDPDACCPHYDRFLREVMPDVDTRRFMHQWGGYSLSGDTSEQRLCFFYGKGKNGKSTLVDAWAAVAGDYGETVPIETFISQGKGRNAGAATPDLAILPGVRFLRTSEPEKGAKLAEALIKLVTGGEPILARHLNSGYFKFKPAFKLTMSGNYRPAIDGTDEGIWRRVALVPWLVTVEKPDRNLPSKLSKEASGILNRLLDGIRDYVDNGLITPPAISEATASYRDDSDPLGRFLRLAVERSEGDRIQSSALHRVFIAWAKAVGEREWTPKGLSLALKERGYKSMQSSVMWWLNVRLTAAGNEFDGLHAPHPTQDDD